MKHDRKEKTKNDAKRNEKSRVHISLKRINSNNDNEKCKEHSSTTKCDRKEKAKNDVKRNKKLRIHISQKRIKNIMSNGNNENVKCFNYVLRALELGEKERVNNALYGIGPQHEIIAEIGNDTVTRQSIQRLRPGAWLNDEVIHFYCAALSRRDSEQNPTKRSHFFKSFFLTKLLEEQNGCKYANAKRWSKKAPGKDMFALDKIFFPVNIDNMHWAASVIFMQEKCIRFYDSMGGKGAKYLEGLLRYLKDEWIDKKKTNRGDWDEWQLIDTKDIPLQQNGEFALCAHQFALPLTTHIEFLD